MTKTQVVKKFRPREPKVTVPKWLKKLRIDTSGRFRSVLLLVTIVVFISTVSSSSYAILRNLILNQIKESTFLQVSQATDQINQWLEVHSLAIELAANTDTARTMNWQKVLPILQYEQKRFNDFSLLNLVFPDGSNYTTKTGKAKTNLSNRRHFKKAMAGQFNISDPVVGKITKIPVIVIASPIRQTADPHSSVIGALFASLSIKRVTQVTNEVHYGKNSYAFVLDSKGEIIVHPNQSITLTKYGSVSNLLRSPEPNLAKLAKKMVHRNQGFELINLDGTQKYVAYLPLKQVNWSLALVIPRAYIESQLDSLYILTVILGLLLLAIVIIFSRQTQLWAKSKGQVVLLGQQSTILQEQAITLEQALQELKKTQSQLVQQEKMSSLGQLVAGLAHEINNPLNFIYGNIALVDQYCQDLFNLIDTYQKQQLEIPVELDLSELDFLQQDFPQLLSSMKSGADRINQIISSLRTFSRLDEATIKAVDLHENIDSTLLILQSRLNNPNKHQIITIIQEYGDLPPVECYPGQINQVFLNILSNAIDAIEGLFAGTNSTKSTEELRIVQPQIRVRTELTPDQSVSIAIANNGPSIPAEIQSNIFNPFFTTKPIGQGAGLGLSISYQIVTEMHHGKLIVVSAPEQLTEFIIQIPLHPISTELKV